MRRTIDTAPRDGKVVILEDDASGTNEVAHWSAEAGGWLGENGEPSMITPTHWHPMSREKYLLQEDEGSSKPSQVGRSASRARRYSFFGDVIAPRSVAMAAPVTVEAFVAQTAPVEAKRAPRRFAASSITATLIAAALIGLYIYVTRYAGQQDIARISTIGGQALPQKTPFARHDPPPPDLFSPHH